MTGLIVFLALANLLVMVGLLMKTTELNNAISHLATHVTSLATSVESAVTALANRGAVTPDADVEAAVANLDGASNALAELKVKLDAALAT